MSALAGRTALVTGASKNIGRAIALRLAGDGADVAVHHHRDEEGARRTVGEVEERGGRGVALQADITDRSEVKELFDRVQEELAVPDILVCNAGYIASSAPVAETPPDAYDRIFAVNARGTFFCLQEGARRMPDGGRIVCTASSNAVRPIPAQAAYSGSKAAVVVFARTLALELGERGVTVNCVSPGPTETTMLDGAVTEEQKKMMAQMSPLGRLGRPDDIGDVVAFLASERGRWITGQNLQVGGGFAMR